jgi:hypothetical protein
MLGVIGLLTFVALSVSAARAAQALWSKCSKCRGKESLRETQRQISLGKSHIR